MAKVDTQFESLLLLTIAIAHCDALKTSWSRHHGARRNWKRNTSAAIQA